MFFQEPIEPISVEQVKSPAKPESLINPTRFYIEFGRNKPMPNGDNLFIRNEYRQVDFLNFEQHVRNYIEINPGWGVYTTAFQYNRKDPYTADLRGDFYLDFDDEDDIHNAQEDALSVFQHLTISPNYKIPKNMIRVFFSGKKGIHITIPYEVFGVEWHPYLDRIYRIMAEELQPYASNGTLDMKVYERRRLFRIQGSQHPSTGSYKVPMELKNLLLKSEQDIQQISKDPNYGSWIKYADASNVSAATKYFKQCEQKFVNRYQNSFNKNDGDTTLSYDPEVFVKLIEQGPVKGSRNEVAGILTSFWRRRGKSEQEAWDLLVEWNNGSLPEFELKRTFNSIWKRKYVYSIKRASEYLV